MVDNEASLAVWRVQEAMAEASAANTNFSITVASRLKVSSGNRGYT
jgi:hypothetical protein